jgi:hypothetical protein
MSRRYTGAPSVELTTRFLYASTLSSCPWGRRSAVPEDESSWPAPE